MALLPVRALLALDQIRIPALLYLVLMPVLVIRDWILLSALPPVQTLLALEQIRIPVVQVVVVFVYMDVERRAWFRSSLSDILKFPRNNVQTSLMFKNLQLQVA